MWPFGEKRTVKLAFALTLTVTVIVSAGLVKLPLQVYISCVLLAADCDCPSETGIGIVPDFEQVRLLACSFVRWFVGSFD